MNKREVMNKYEGQKVAELTWPFYRFNTLLPSKIKGDNFVWLYLSLVVFVNQSKKLLNTNYNEEVKVEAMELIKNNFSSIIDNQTLEAIISNAEKEFVQDGKLKNDTSIFLNGHENLFSEELVSMKAYQDAITGDILPFFGEKIDENSYFNNNFLQVKISELKFKDPSLKAIKKAFNEYHRLKKYDSNSYKPYIEENESLNNIEKNYDSELIDKSNKLEKADVKDINNFRILTLYDTKEKVNEKVDVYIIENKISLKSSFGSVGDWWLLSRLVMGGNISEEIEKELAKLKNNFCIEAKPEDEFSELKSKDLVLKLKYCNEIYQLIDPINDNMIRKYVVKLDAELTERSDDSYTKIGQIMELLIKKINYESTTSYEAIQTDFDFFCIEMRNKCKSKVKDPNFLNTEKSFERWKAKFITNEKTREKMKDFKADLTDVIYKSSFLDSSFIYDEIIKDIYSLYGLRNKFGSHGSFFESNLNVSEIIEKLTKIIKVIVSMI